MKSFTLTGEGIEVRYSADDGVLTVQGENLPSGDREFSGEKLVISASGLGTMLTGIILPTARDWSQSRLSVLVPSGIREMNEAPITGAAIIVRDRSGINNSKRGPLQSYDVRELSGTMQD
jgi:hypothetical protein